MFNAHCLKLGRCKSGTCGFGVQVWQRRDRASDRLARSKCQHKRRRAGFHLQGGKRPTRGKDRETTTRWRKFHLLRTTGKKHSFFRAPEATGGGFCPLPTSLHIDRQASWRKKFWEFHRVASPRSSADTQEEGAHERAPAGRTWREVSSSSETGILACRLLINSGELLRHNQLIVSNLYHLNYSICSSNV